MFVVTYNNPSPSNPRSCSNASIPIPPPIISLPSDSDCDCGCLLSGVVKRKISFGAVVIEEIVRLPESYAMVPLWFELRES